MTVDRLIRHFNAREYMELCKEKIDKCILKNMQQKHNKHLTIFEGSLKLQTTLTKLNTDGKTDDRPHSVFCQMSYSTQNMVPDVT